MQLKLAGGNKSSLAIPQKVKVVSKSRGQLNSSVGNLSNKQLIVKKRSPTPQEQAARDASKEKREI